MTIHLLNAYEAKSRKYRGVFKVKSRVKARQVREIWSQQLEHKQVPKKRHRPTKMEYYCCNGNFVMWKLKSSRLS